MAFDAPGSEQQVWAWLVLFVVLSISFWFVVGPVVACALYLQDWPGTSLVLAATPLGAATVGWLLLQLA